jgi:vacuolar-type H+-ATPase subunit H
VLKRTEFIFMKLNNWNRTLSNLRRGFAVGFLSVLATVFFWQSALIFNSAAIAVPLPVMAADMGDRVQGKANEDAGRAKSFIRDTADKVERTAKKNAEKVDNATDDDSVLGKRAREDAGRIRQNAERDTARTQKAVDKTKNAIENAVDNVKDAFNQ